MGTCVCVRVPVLGAVREAKRGGEKEAFSPAGGVYLCAGPLWAVFSVTLFVSQVFCIEQI